MADAGNQANGLAIEPENPPHENALDGSGEPSSSQSLNGLGAPQASPALNGSGELLRRLQRTQTLPAIKHRSTGFSEDHSGSEGTVRIVSVAIANVD
jgi:hypothetical protein